MLHRDFSSPSPEYETAPEPISENQQTTAHGVAINLFQATPLEMGYPRVYWAESVKVRVLSF